MQSGLKGALRFAYSFVAARRVRTFVRTQPDAGDLLRFMHGTSPRLDSAFRIIQIDAEIEALCAELAADPPRRVLEIGTAGGGTLLLLAAVSRHDATLVSVDLPQPSGYAIHRERIYRAAARSEQRIELVRGDSHRPATLRCVSAIFAGEPVDVLFIDGDHTLEGVAADYATYAPLVRPGGVIALHDIVEGPVDFVGGVPAFWRTLKGRPSDQQHEIVADYAQGGLGIGVIRLPRS